MKEALNDRNEEARKAAASFRDDLKAGILDPKADGFNQGQATLPDPEEEAKEWASRVFSTAASSQALLQASS